MNWWITSNMPIVMWVGLYSSRGADWWSTSVFFKLTSNPKSWEASVKQKVMHNKALSVWATRAALLAKLRSWISCLRIFILACNHRGLNRLLSRWYLTLSSIPVIKIICTRAKDSEENQYQDATQLHYVGDQEGLREVTIHFDLVILVFVLLNDHVQEPNHSIIYHIPPLLTVSNALINLLLYLWHFSWNCQRTITMFVVFLLDLKPFWFSGRCSSTMDNQDNRDA